MARGTTKQPPPSADGVVDRARKSVTPSILWILRQTRAARALALWLPRYANQRGPRADALFLTLGAAVGLLGAVGVQIFFNLIDLANDALVVWPMSLQALSGRWIVVPLLTGAALALAAWLMRRFGNGYDGLNVPDVQHAVTRGDGHLPPRPALAKSVASAVTIGGGGSAGSEGPVAVLGAALASAFARPLKLRAARVRVLVGAGSAAAISATFGAPLAGAFFALEEILKSSSTTAFAPVVVASVVAHATSLVFFGDHGVFPQALTYGYNFYREVFFFFPLLGVLTGLMAALFVMLEDRVARARWRRVTPSHALPWLGGAAVGLIMVAGQGLLTSRGHYSIDFDALARVSWGLLLLLAVGKIVATVLTLNCGGSGGVFAPSLTIGAMTGIALGLLLQRLFPELPLEPASYALVGMGSLVAATTGAPITAILLVFEITQDHGILLPLMLSVVVAVTVRRLFTHETLYTAWLLRTGRSKRKPEEEETQTGEFMSYR
ncbi:MAG TPA: chloride channel protein [Gemmatimonadaceae bacterium]|nr:chloride channel protein [Gemmatimonadaceae bacterium]